MILRVYISEQVGHIKCMENVEKMILSAYVPYVTTLRNVARTCGTDHHRVKRVLEQNGIAIVKGKLAPFSDQHRAKIGAASKGRTSWAKGKKMPKLSLYKNMASHLRFDVSAEWLLSFEDIEKLKFLNRSITCRGGRFDMTTDDYKAYVFKFYNDAQFNRIYERWLHSEQCKWKRPTIDHIDPRANGGCNRLDNLQFLTWFENRAKCDMTQKEWDAVKENMKDYLT